MVRAFLRLLDSGNCGVVRWTSSPRKAWGAQWLVSTGGSFGGSFGGISGGSSGGSGPLVAVLVGALFGSSGGSEPLVAVLVGALVGALI